MATPRATLPRTTGSVFAAATLLLMVITPAHAQETPAPPADPILFHQSSTSTASEPWTVRPDSGEAAPLWPDEDIHLSSPRFSPDGQRILGGSGGAGPPSVHIRGLDGELHDTLGGSGPTHSVGWAPDGDHVAYFDGCSAHCDPAYPGYRVYDVEEQRTVLRLTLAGEHSHWPAHRALQDWHPDGEHLTFSDDTEVRNLVADGSGDHEPLLDHDHPVETLRWSPTDGRLAFSSVVGDSWDLLVSDVHGAEPTVVASFDAPIDSIAWSPDTEWLALSGDLGSGHGIYILPVEAPDDITHLHTFTDTINTGHLDW